MHINTSRKSGFTLVEIMIVVAIIGLLAAIAIPNFVKARETAQRNACMNNLVQIDGAKQQWAADHKKQASDTPTAQDLDAYLRTSFSALRCPAGGVYSINAVGVEPTCSIPRHMLAGTASRDRL